MLYQIALPVLLSAHPGAVAFDPIAVQPTHQFARTVEVGVTSPLAPLETLTWVSLSIPSTQDDPIVPPPSPSAQDDPIVPTNHHPTRR